MVTLSFDITDLSKQLNALRRVTGITAAATVTRTARLWLRDCVRLTPPTGKGKVATSKAAQKKKGLKAIRRDVGTRAFPLLSKIIPRKENSKFSKAVWRMARKGQIEKLQEVLRLRGIEFGTVVQEPTEARHRKLRNRYGAVPKRAKPFLVLKDRSASQFLKRALDRSGRAKNGWQRAATALGLGRVGWGKTSSPGLFRGIRNRAFPEIEFGNGTNFLQDSYYERSIMKRTLAFRARAMAAEMKRLLQGLNNAGKLAKLRAKFANPKNSFEALE